MGNGVCNIAKGRAKGYYDRVKSNDPAASILTLVLFTGTEADGDLEDFDTLAAVLAGSLSEATFTNYAREQYTDAQLAATPAPDDTGNTNGFTIPDRTITAAGGTVDNTLTRAVLCYDPDGTDTDASMIPLTYHDFSVTTNGGDLTIDAPAADLFLAS